MSESAKKDISQVDQISENFRSALVRCSDDPLQKILTPDLLRGLLMLPSQSSEDTNCDEHDACPSPLGLPRRPYYRELARRIVHVSGDDDQLLPAEELGMSELSSTKIIRMPPQPELFSEESCFEWLKEAGDGGILRILGMRNTVGTEVGLLPPDWDELLAASRLPHKDLAPPHDSLTVAGRARCKHAHRGTCSQDDFFGEVAGGTREKNEAAERVLVKILKDAAWINIHRSTGIDETVLEVRVAAGYGARWTADWSLDPVNPTAVAFRGFLEPNQVYGHEKRWRH